MAWPPETSVMIPAAPPLNPVPAPPVVVILFTAIAPLFVFIVTAPPVQPVPAALAAPVVFKLPAKATVPPPPVTSISIAPEVVPVAPAAAVVVMEWPESRVTAVVALTSTRAPTVVTSSLILIVAPVNVVVALPDARDPLVVRVPLPALSVKEPFATAVDKAPATVKLLFLLLTSKSPPRVDVANVVFTLFTTVASPVVPLVLRVMAPAKAFDVLSSVMALLATSVVKLEVPATVKAPVWVIASPDLAVKLPSTVDKPSFKAVVPLSTAASAV